MIRITSFSGWKKEQERLAKELQKIANRNGSLPEFPDDMIDWVYEARPYIGTIKRDFRLTPFWMPIYRDGSHFQMVMGGRQIYKSTFCTDMIAATATQNPASQVCYVTYDESSLSLFSKQKLRIETFLVNGKLCRFLRHPGNVHEISLKNNSTIYLVTDNNQYRHLEGRSPILTILDEAQYQDLEYFGKVRQTMMATKGKVKVLGIGGESGSPYEKLWSQTNQMEWIYDDPNWRDRLEFDDNGLVVGDYLDDVLRGSWIPQNDRDVIGTGYRIPQTIIPTIPMTEDDAILKYKISPTYSIEYQQKELTGAQFESHVLGEFFNSPHRPITFEMIERVTNPYRYLGLSSISEIANTKDAFYDNVLVSMGVDFGSGKESHTVIAILIWWKKSDRIQLAYIERRPPENQLEQAEYIASMFKDAKCDIGVGDLGYGANQVKRIQDGGANNQTGELFEGVGKNKFFGCRTISDVTKEHQTFHEKVDEHGEEVGRIQIDKTQKIDHFIDTINKQIPHPASASEKLRRARLMIPSKLDYEIDFLTNDMMGITRRDTQYLQEQQYDRRQDAKKQYNHPPDSVMGIIYGMVGIEHYRKARWNWVSW